MLKQISEPKYGFLFELDSLVTTDESQSEPRGGGKYPALIRRRMLCGVKLLACGNGVPLSRDIWITSGYSAHFSTVVHFN